MNINESGTSLRSVQALWSLDAAAAFAAGESEINNSVFFGDKILHLESDFRKLGSVAVLRSRIRILRASLAQIDTEMAEKYVKLAEI